MSKTTGRGVIAPKNAASSTGTEWIQKQLAGRRLSGPDPDGQMRAQMAARQIRFTGAPQQSAADQLLRALVARSRGAESETPGAHAKPEGAGTPAPEAKPEQSAPLSAKVRARAKQAARETGLPAPLADRLHGSTYAEVLADAQALRASLGDAPSTNDLFRSALSSAREA